VLGCGELAAPRAPRPSLAEAVALLEALSESQEGEIIDGELHVQPRPRFRHRRASGFFGVPPRGALDFDSNGPGGWWILIEPGINLPGSPEVSPDLAGWRRSPLPAPPPENEPLRTVPDWRMRVPWLWLVDTRQETLQVNPLVGERWSIHGVWSDEASVRLPPFEAIELQLGALWTSMRPAPTDEPR
jgi:hypothetical protein